MNWNYNKNPDVNEPGQYLCYIDEGDFKKFQVLKWDGERFTDNYGDNWKVIGWVKINREEVELNKNDKEETITITLKKSQLEELANMRCTSSYYDDEPYDYYVCAVCGGEGEHYEGCWIRKALGIDTYILYPKIGTPIKYEHPKIDPLSDEEKKEEISIYNKMCESKNIINPPPLYDDKGKYNSLALKLVM